MRTKMERIYIIGAGAIGKVLAAFLVADGRNVTLIKARARLATEVESLPVSVDLTDGASINATIKVSDLAREKNLDGLVVLANKSVGNVDIATSLSGKCGDSPIVVLQNGLHVEEPFLQNNFNNVYRCVLFATSQQLTSSTLRFRPVAPSPVGWINGNKELLPEIISLLNTKLFQFRAEENIQPVIWRKVIANCVFNSVCPLLETDNGIFHRDEQARSLAIQIISECVAVGKRAGVILDENKVLETVLQISRASDGQLISTLQDIRSQRLTEIDSLNFAIVKAATHLGMLERVSKTKMLGELIRLKAALNLKS